ncbi:cysteine desulfurase family protein [uncultured Propionivibrio sp.]|uniref:cysteine desulfurase family protein n=1 Tax=uncultured Propionivibrio sp. TaxID=426737 RepID=UPI0029C0FC2E|nr:cysteine desulfurase family protein [uncultured Propionivibrio sp.]
MFAPVYLDHNATTPLDPAVLDAMMPWLSQRFGNASSRHEYGRDARRAIDAAREQVARAVGAHATEVVFTSGGSEANNLFVKGVAARLRPGLAAISAVEHPCVLKPAGQLARQGWDISTLPVDAQGCVDVAAYRETVARRPRFVSVMAANNETGVVQDIAALSAQAKAAGAWFHADAVQALGKMPVDFRALNAQGVNALTISAHKIGGPQGAGALIVDKRVELEPLIAGGGHERGLRSGTENVAAIVGFGAACALAVERLEEVSRRLPALRLRIEAGLAEMGAVVFGLEAPRLPNTVLFSIPGIEGETLVGQLDRAGFAVASGAACSSANPEPSHVLQAMAVPPVLARGAVRVSLGVSNTEQHMDDFLLTLQETVSKLRRLSAIAV